MSLKKTIAQIITSHEGLAKKHQNNIIPILADLIDSEPHPQLYQHILKSLTHPHFNARTILFLNGLQNAHALAMFLDFQNSPRIYSMFEQYKETATRAINQIYDGDYAYALNILSEFLNSHRIGLSDDCLTHLRRFFDLRQLEITKPTQRNEFLKTIYSIPEFTMIANTYTLHSYLYNYLEEATTPLCDLLDDKDIYVDELDEALSEMYLILFDVTLHLTYKTITPIDSAIGFSEDDYLLLLSEGEKHLKTIDNIVTQYDAKRPLPIRDLLKDINGSITLHTEFIKENGDYPLHH